MNPNRQFRRRVRFRDRKAYSEAQRIAARLERAARLSPAPPPPPRAADLGWGYQFEAPDHEES